MVAAEVIEEWGAPRRLKIGQKSFRWQSPGSPLNSAQKPLNTIQKIIRVICKPTRKEEDKKQQTFLSVINHVQPTQFSSQTTLQGEQAV